MCKNPRLFGLLVLGFMLCFAGCDEPDDTLITVNDIPAASGPVIQEFNFIRDECLGMTVRNRNHFIGYTRASSSAKWYPVNGEKTVLVGMLQDYFVYNATEPFGWGDEYDWNIRIIPNGGFQHILYQNPPNFNHGTEYKQCDFNGSKVNCLYAEVTPDESLYENPWFPNHIPNPRGNEIGQPKFLQPPAIMEGGLIAVYGAWVRDDDHGYWPEIHPVEAIWWKRSSSAADTFYVMSLLDDSNRYNTRDRFETTDTSFHPWAEAPMVHEIRIPFEYDFKHSDHYMIDVQELRSRNIVTSSTPNAQDSDDNRFHKLKINGVRPDATPISGTTADPVIVEVTENLNDANIGVQFSDMKRLPDGHIIGYTKLVTAHSLVENGKEGYHVLKITVKRPQNVISEPVILH